MHGGETDTVAPKCQHEPTDFGGDGAADPTDLYGYVQTLTAIPLKVTMTVKAFWILKAMVFHCN